MVEDTNDGTLLRRRLRPAPRSAPGTGPIAVGTFNYAMSEQSLAIRAAANEAIRRSATRRGLGRFMALTETQGVYCAHPLGGCRMADSADLGVVDDAGAVYGYEGLYCIDSSIVPTSLGRQPVADDLGPERALRRATGHNGRNAGAPAPPARAAAEDTSAAHRRARHPASLGLIRLSPPRGTVSRAQHAKTRSSSWRIRRARPDSGADLGARPSG